MRAALSVTSVSIVGKEAGTVVKAIKCNARTRRYERAIALYRKHVSATGEMHCLRGLSRKHPTIHRSSHRSDQKLVPVQAR